jgi:putative peptide modification system cyclase
VNAILHAPNTEAPPRQDTPVSLLRTLVLCDLADSTALVERLGDLRAAELFRKHDRLARTLVHQFGGREIDKTDGFLMMFNRPIEAVAFALAYQRGLRQLEDAGIKAPLRARVGVHVGDVIAWDNTPEDIAKGAKPFEVEGLIKPVTSRLMQLALPGQILLSGVAYQLAHRAQDELGDQAATTLWRTHGRYRFKGLPDPIAVFEVGEADIAPLKAPPWSGKAHREVPFWRRPATMAIEIALLISLVALPLWYLLRPEPAIAFVKRDWVVVGNLTNLTGETTFDESVETAFRIGLEQSRYVNVLSDLKTRETVKLMQRDPEKTKVDRTIGSEVAIRDGARALILPTVAEIGGRVRVTAEVIDPHTQTTVWSESADGAGEESVLPSLDKVNQKLRVRLGEALATVSNESQPLDKVATKNLDALRAYSLAERAYQAEKIAESVALYRQALKLDPDFALAHIGLARLLVVSDDKQQASKELETASRTHDRLSPRDALFIEAWQASLQGSYKTALEKWKLLSSLYPDLFAAHGLYAYFAWQFANRYDDDVVESAKKAASPRNPYAPKSLLLLGTLYVANERFDDAEDQFAQARKSGMDWHVDYMFADAARRRFDAAQATLAQTQTSGVASRDIDVLFRRILLSADRGAWDDAWKDVAQARRESAKVSADVQRRFALVEASLRLSVDPDALDGKALRESLRPVIERVGKSSGEYRADAQLDAMFAAYLAARRGNAEIAREALGTAQPTDGNYPVLTRMLTVADAERLHAEGKPEETIRLLKPTLDGAELYITHVALMEAYEATKDYKAALDEARWLASHRGRAYAEYDPNRVPFNVIQSDLAPLHAAAAAAALGDESDARRSLDTFLKNWPHADELPFAKARIRKLQTKS